MRETPPRKILIAGDASLQKNLVEQLASAPDLALLKAKTLSEAAEIAMAKSADLLVIDGELAVPDARPFIARLRSTGFVGPIVLLAPKERDPAMDLVECLARPFRIVDLLKRLRALLRPREIGSDEKLTIGPYSFRPGSGDLVSPRGERVRLTQRESAILLRLAQAKGAAVSRDRLLRDAWGYSPEVATRTLETHVYRIRRKIEADPLRPSILITDAGGYRLNAGEATFSAPRD